MAGTDGHAPGSDAELIAAARTGDTEAFAALYERHAVAARAVARQYSRSAADAEDAVADAFERVLSALRGGGGPDVAFRAYLFTVVRRVTQHRAEAARRATPTDDVAALELAAGAVGSTEEPALAAFERDVVVKAYGSLPERWQAVLWYTEIEGLRPADVAPVLGMSANGVAALAYRAREGLRQAYLSQHVATPLADGCVAVSGKLGAYVRGALASRETGNVEGHLETCAQCRRLVAELGDVNHGLHSVIAPLVLGVAAVEAVRGLGFGGAAAGVTAAAGIAGGSAAVGSGTTAVGAGAGGGAGTVATATSAGAGAAGSTSAGVTAGMSAGTLAGGAAAGGAVAGGAAAGGAGIGALAGAGAATGLAAVVAGMPVGALAAGATGVLVAAAVGVGSAMGSPSTGPAGPATPPAATTPAGPDRAETGGGPPSGSGTVAPTDLPQLDPVTGLPAGTATGSAPGPDGTQVGVPPTGSGGGSEGAAPGVVEGGADGVAAGAGRSRSSGPGNSGPGNGGTSGSGSSGPGSSGTSGSGSSGPGNSGSGNSGRGNGNGGSGGVLPVPGPLPVSPPDAVVPGSSGPGNSGNGNGKGNGGSGSSGPGNGNGGSGNGGSGNGGSGNGGSGNSGPGNGNGNGSGGSGSGGPGNGNRPGTTPPVVPVPPVTTPPVAPVPPVDVGGQGGLTVPPVDVPLPVG